MRRLVGVPGWRAAFGGGARMEESKAGPSRVLVFGFGSLISAESRLITVGEATPAAPALVKGYVRGFMGLVPKSAAVR